MTFRITNTTNRITNTTNRITKRHFALQNALTFTNAMRTFRTLTRNELGITAIYSLCLSQSYMALSVDGTRMASKTVKLLFYIRLLDCFRTSDFHLFCWLLGLLSLEGFHRVLFLIQLLLLYRFYQLVFQNNVLRVVNKPCNSEVGLIF